MDGTERGHRVVPHTADLRVEAWGPTREQCVAEAVLGAVESFVDATGAGEPGACDRRVEAATDEDLLVAVLDELIYLLDTTGQVPAGVVVEPRDVGAEVRFAMVDAERLPQVGAVPKAISLHRLGEDLPVGAPEVRRGGHRAEVGRPSRDPTGTQASCRSGTLMP